MLKNEKVEKKKRKERKKHKELMMERTEKGAQLWKPERRVKE